MQSFEQFSSSFEIDFWLTLAEKKINVFGLDDHPVEISAWYSEGSKIRASDSNSVVQVPAELQFSAHSFERKRSKPGVGYTGLLLNTNTIEAFNHLDKNELSRGLQQSIWSAISDRTAWEEPEKKLNQFLLIMFGDLKKFSFRYWLNALAFHLPEPAVRKRERFAADEFTMDELETIGVSVKSMLGKGRGYFVVERAETINVSELKVLKGRSDLRNCFIGFIDPSAHKTALGWPLRNLLILLKSSLDVSSVQIISWRKQIQDSFIVELEIPGPSLNAMPKSSGWEKREDGKLIYKTIDLSSTLDPKT